MNIQEKIYRYFEQYPDLHVLFVFDPNNVHSMELMGAQWPENFLYETYDGCAFATKCKMHQEWLGKKVILIIPEISEPKNHQERLDFALMGELTANAVFQEQGYQEFMQQYGLREELATFVSKHIDDLNNTKIKAALEPYMNRDMFTMDVAQRAMLSVYLGQETTLSWEDIFIRLFVICGADNAKRSTDFFTKLKKKPDLEKTLSERLMDLSGQTFEVNTNEKIKKVAESIKYNAITELLPEISADDYKAYKITSQPKIEKINRLLERVAQMPKLEKPFTTALMKLSKDIREEEIIKWYGWDANFHYVSDELCWPIIAQLADGQIEADPVRANSNLRALKQKKADDSAVVPAIDYLSKLAFYYEKAKAIGSLVLNTPDDYIKFYTERFYLIDQYYRLAVENYYQLKLSEMPISKVIYKTRDFLNEHYAKITNLLNLEWTKCLEEKGNGFKSISLNRQYNFYKDNIENSQNNVTVIISDALRYEMAEELMEKLGTIKHSAKMGAMLGTLPSETKFAKYSLFPYSELVLDGPDMKMDGECTTNIAKEKCTAQLAKFKEGALCVSFDKVKNYSDENRANYFRGRPVVYVFHDTIDDTGHNDNPSRTVNECRNSVNELVEFIGRLHASYNVTNVILTSDHGFLLNDIEFKEKDKHPVKEDFVEKKTRYYLTRRDDIVDGATKFKLTEVSAMTDYTMWVKVPSGTNRFSASGGYSFAHGGATLQELLIPVIYSSRKKTKGKEKVGVSVLEANLRMTSSRLKFTVIQSEAISEDLQERTVQCAVFVGNDQVTAWKDVTLNSSDEENVNNRLTSVELMLNVQTDANLMELRIYDKDDDSKLNPLVKKAVINKTLIEQDF